MSGEGHNSADRELYNIVREIELIEEDIRDRNRAKSDIYKAADSKGFDKKIIRKVVAARKLDPFEREEDDNTFDLYMAAVESAEKGLVRARVENIEEFDAETGEITESLSSQNPAGEKIRSAQGGATEVEPTTGQQPVGSASPHSNPQPTSRGVPPQVAETRDAGAPVAAASPSSSPRVQHEEIDLTIPEFLRRTA